MLPLSLRRREAREDPASLVRREFDRLFRSPWWGPAVGTEAETTGAYPVDVREEDNAVVVEAEMPGFTKDDIDVTLDGDVLRITAEREPEEAQGTRLLSERRYTRVERAFTLPAPVDDSSVEAKLKDGVLHLRLPKTSESTSKRIEIM